MKHFLTPLLFLMSGLIQAQVVPYWLIYSTGGSYATPGNWVRVESKILSSGTYVKLDSAQGDFSNDLITEGVYAYAHIGRANGHPQGKDVIYKYSLPTRLRLDSITNIGGARRMATSTNHLIVTRGFGADSNYIMIYNKNNLNGGPVYLDTVINTFTQDVLVIKDTAYISYTRNDTGKIARILLTGSSPVFLDSIVMDTLASGIDKLYSDGNFIYGLAHKSIFPPPSFAEVVISAGVVKISLTSGAYNFYPTPKAQGGIGYYGGDVYANYSTGPGIWNATSNSLTVNPAFPLSYTRGCIDTVLATAFFQQTDYFSTGSIIQTDASGTRLDSFATDISGSALELIYNGLPIANDAQFQTPINTTLTQSMSGIAGDADGGSVGLAAVSGPLNGSASFIGNSLIYIPNTGFVGTDTLNYRVTDLWGDTAIARIEIAVGLSNRENILTNSIKVWPNPASDYLSFELNTPALVRTQIFDMQGKIWQENNTADRTLQVNDLPSGMYILIISTDTQKRFCKWVKL
ncbi:MAG: T9SS C-terminal target domain-containing protein [Sphingobacteriia bacterium]|nr:T9SS C-terminal target domain-containing protein [Sphingobacteriia bacterium]